MKGLLLFLLLPTLVLCASLLAELEENVLRHGITERAEFFSLVLSRLKGRSLIGLSNMCASSSLTSLCAISYGNVNPYSFVRDWTMLYDVPVFYDDKNGIINWDWKDTKK